MQIYPKLFCLTVLKMIYFENFLHNELIAKRRRLTNPQLSRQEVECIRQEIKLLEQRQRDLEDPKFLGDLLGPAMVEIHARRLSDILAPNTLSKALVSARPKRKLRL